MVCMAWQRVAVRYLFFFSPLALARPDATVPPPHNDCGAPWHGGATVMGGLRSPAASRGAVLFFFFPLFPPVLASPDVIASLPPPPTSTQMRRGRLMRRCGLWCTGTRGGPSLFFLFFLLPSRQARKSWRLRLALPLSDSDRAGRGNNWGRSSPRIARRARDGGARQRHCRRRASLTTEGNPRGAAGAVMCPPLNNVWRWRTVTGRVPGPLEMHPSWPHIPLVPSSTAQF